MERVESRLLAGVQGPGFAAIKQSAEHTGFINVHLGFCGQHSVVLDPLGRSVSPIALFVAIHAFAMDRGLSDREMWTQMDLFSNRQIFLDDQKLLASNFLSKPQ